MNRKLLLGFDPRSSAEHRKMINIAEKCKGFFNGVKAQMACYQSPEGMRDLWQLRTWCKNRGLYIMLDGKWGDVPHTMEKYAKNFAWADGVTVSPLFGKESLEPFKEFKGDVFVVCDPSSNGFYLNRLPQDVIGHHLLDWGVVVGASKVNRHKEFLKRYNAIVLTPGVGAQGAPIPGIDNCYIPISRGIMEADDPVAKCKEYYNIIHKNE